MGAPTTVTVKRIPAKKENKDVTKPKQGKCQRILPNSLIATPCCLPDHTMPAKSRCRARKALGLLRVWGFSLFPSFTPIVIITEHAVWETSRAGHTGKGVFLAGKLDAPATSLCRLHPLLRKGAPGLACGQGLPLGKRLAPVGSIRQWRWPRRQRCLATAGREEAAYVQGDKKKRQERECVPSRPLLKKTTISIYYCKLYKRGK